MGFTLWLLDLLDSEAIPAIAPPHMIWESASELHTRLEAVTE